MPIPKGEKITVLETKFTRAAVSVMNNIAEGFERSTDKEFAYFLSIAKASSGEVRSMLYISQDINYITPTESERLRCQYELLSRRISKFITYLQH